MGAAYLGASDGPGGVSGVPGGGSGGPGGEHRKVNRTVNSEHCYPNSEQRSQPSLLTRSSQGGP